MATTTTSRTATGPASGRSPRPARWARALALTAGVAAVVIGILGMHALTLHSTHATQGMHGMPAGGDRARDHGATSAAMRGAVAQGHLMDTVASVVTGAPDGEEDTGGMVMLCLAMLAAGSALLLVLRRLDRAGQAGLLGRFVRPTLLRVRPVTAYLPTGPPVAWRFSVIRC